MRKVSKDPSGPLTELRHLRPGATFRDDHGDDWLVTDLSNYPRSMNDAGEQDAVMTCVRIYDGVTEDFFLGAEFVPTTLEYWDA